MGRAWGWGEAPEAHGVLLGVGVRAQCSPPTCPDPALIVVGLTHDSAHKGPGIGKTVEVAGLLSPLSQERWDRALAG